MSHAMLFLHALLAFPFAQPAPSPPIANKIAKVTPLHGDKLLDNYYWLRNKTSPEVRAYLEDENAYADAVMKPTAKLQETLYQEMRGRIKEADLSVPYRRGDFWYYVRTEKDKQYPIHCRKKESLEGKEEIVLDLNELAKGKAFLALDMFRVSDDGNLLAFTLDVTGFRDYTLFVKDLRDGTLMPENIAKVQGVEWAADNRTLIYVVEDHAKRAFRAYRHRLGERKDEVVYEEKDEMYRLSVSRSKDKAYLFLLSNSLTTTEVRGIPSGKADAGPRLLLPREEGHRCMVEHYKGGFLFLTNKDAKNFRLVSAPLLTPNRWTERVAHDPKIALTGMELYRGHIVLSERVDGLPAFRIIDLKNGKEERLTFPETLYEASEEENPDFDTPRFRYSYQSFLTPKSIFEVDLETRATTRLKSTEVPNYDAEKYTSRRIFATATDGTRIPISLLHAITTKLDGSSPLLLYGYGAYGSSMPVAFNSNRFSLVDRGMIFAIAHVRGGGEFGPGWHDQGKMLAKRNSFTDFIACADHLIKEKLTNRDRLVIQGRSAGGLLIGGVLTLRPDLAKAAVLEVPFVEAINSMLDLDMPLVIQEFLEWGDPRKKAEYSYMKSYCPYSNLKAQRYPAMLLTSYFHDSQVMYWEPVKYTAKLRTLKTDDNVLLLKTNLTGGHGGASGRFDALREQAFVYAFMLGQAGVK